MSAVEWVDPTERLPKERQDVMVMLRNEGDKPSVSGPYTAWLRYVGSTGEWFFVIPARGGRVTLCGVPLVWRAMNHDDKAARAAARAALARRPDEPMDAYQSPEVLP